MTHRSMPPGGIVVTAAGPQMQPALHDLALPTFRRWADRHGWDVIAHNLATDGVAADDGAQRAKWAKVALLRDALRNYPLALWVDADVLLMRHDEDVSIHLHPEHFQALALEQVPSEHRVNPNTGVWLLRSCAESTAFLDAVQQVGPQPGPWADQGAVLAALGWDRGDERYHWARPGVGSRFLEGTSWLPPGWNQPSTEGREAADCFNSAAGSYADRPRVPDPHALHFMGMTPTARYRAMARAASHGLAAKPALAKDIPVPLTAGALSRVSTATTSVRPAPAARGAASGCSSPVRTAAGTRGAVDNDDAARERGLAGTTAHLAEMEQSRRSTTRRRL